MIKKFLGLALLALLVFGVSQSTVAQKDDSKETGAEAIWGSNGVLRINRAGSYKLSRAITVRSGDAILITASNVSLDLNGLSVGTRAAGNGRGVVVSGASNVSVRNGSLGGFNQNVAVENSENVSLNSLQITGAGLAPDGGPSEIGILLVNSRSANVSGNTISSVNLGIFVRGGRSTGNRIFENIVVGGANPSNNLLGICYNPAPDEGTVGPRGDNIYNNHIARFGFAISVSTGSQYNIFNENTLAGFNGAFSDTSVLTINGGTNVSEGNIEVPLPAEAL